MGRAPWGEQLMATKHDLQGVLARHIGKANGATASALSAALGVTTRAVRHLVTELREDGTAVCGTPRDGYFIAANAEELERTLAFLRSRAMHSLTLESRLRRMPLADLVGQLRLKT